MSARIEYLSQAPEREQLAQTKGPLLVLFGSPNCVHCQAFEPVLQGLLKAFPEVPVIAVEDGRGRRLGRLFAVKLWPTVLLLEEGQERLRAVRARDLSVFSDYLRELPQP